MPRTSKLYLTPPRIQLTLSGALHLDEYIDLQSNLFNLEFCGVSQMADRKPNASKMDISA